jgi:hypothetical protein
MARKLRELLWRLREDTADEILELQQCGEVSAWLEEPSEPNAPSSVRDLDTIVDFTEGGLSSPGLSLKMH